MPPGMAAAGAFAFAFAFAFADARLEGSPLTHWFVCGDTAFALALALVGALLVATAVEAADGDAVAVVAGRPFGFWFGFGLRGGGTSGMAASNWRCLCAMSICCVYRPSATCIAPISFTIEIFISYCFSRITVGAAVQEV